MRVDGGRGKQPVSARGARTSPAGCSAGDATRVPLGDRQARALAATSVSAPGHSTQSQLQGNTGQARSQRKRGYFPLLWCLNRSGPQLCRHRTRVTGERQGAHCFCCRVVPAASTGRGWSGHSAPERRSRKTLPCPPERSYVRKGPLKSTLHYI